MSILHDRLNSNYYNPPWHGLPKDDPGFAAEEAEYRQAVGRAEEEFFADLCASEDIPTDHPKARTLYSIAWRMGHAYGYSEVAIHFSDMAELIK